MPYATIGLLLHMLVDRHIKHHTVLQVLCMHLSLSNTSSGRGGRSNMSGWLDGRGVAIELQNEWEISKND